MSASLTVVPEPASMSGSRETGGAALTAVDKAMVVLTSVIGSGKPLSLAELIRRTGLPKSTTHRLLAALCAHRMVERRDGFYYPGECVVKPALPESHSVVPLLRSESTPYLVELHAATGGTASVCAMASTGPVCVNQIYGHRGIRLGSSSTVPSAIIKILHAHHAENGYMLPGRLSAGELSKIRSTGVAHADEPARGISSVAITLRDVVSGRNWPAVLAVSGGTRTLDVAAATRELRRCAYSLARNVQLHIGRRDGMDIGTHVQSAS
ncbi:helix-turn-helix domain-containing protein [Lentzea sp. NPDC004782]|uniref:helix-turn-helix domain-containing protein n=1 Tax=Lentzea sp. NPDC004782 TaxID=3154458 RepID=UPI0033A65B5C